MKSSIKSLPKSQTEVTVQAGETDLKQAKSLALRKLGQDIKISGFRQGKAPLSLIKENMGNSIHVLEETLHQLASLAYVFCLDEHKIRAVGPPDIEVPQIKKTSDLNQLSELARAENLTIVLTFSVWPKVELGDYKKIVAEAKAGKTIETAATLQEAKKKAHKTRKEIKKKVEDSIKKTPQEVKNERIQEILKALVEKIQIEIPDELLKQELAAKIKTAEENTKKIGLSLEDYLKSKNSNLDEFKKQMKNEIESGMRARLILEAIGEDIQRPVEKESDLEYILGYLLEKI